MSPGEQSGWRAGWKALLTAALTGGTIAAVLAEVVGAIIGHFSEQRRHDQNVRNAALAACSQAEIKLREAGKLFSAGFPSLMCRSSYVSDQPVPWDPMADMVDSAQPLIDQCRSADEPRANRLAATAAMGTFLRSYENSLALGEGRELDAIPGWDLVKKLPESDPLRAARQVERALDKLEFQFSRSNTDPCAGPESKARWESLHSEVATGIRALANAGAVSDARGCAWMFLAEQADLQSMGCGSDAEAKLLEAAVGYGRAMELGADRNMLVDAVVGAMLTATRGTSGLSNERVIEIKDHASFALSQDATLLADKQMELANEELDGLLHAMQRGESGFVRWRTDFLAERWRTDQRVARHELRNGLRLADAWLDEGRVAEGSSVLRGVDSVSNGRTTNDYRYHVLLGKALCVDGAVENDPVAIDSMTTAISLNAENPRNISLLGRQWGRAEVLKPLCQIATGHIRATDLPDRFDEVDYLIPEVCDVLAFPSFRQRLQAREPTLAATWIHECEL